MLLFRSLEEIKQYLDNFLPNVPPLFGLQALIIRPTIIIFNIFFIIYEFDYIVLNNSSYIIEKQQKLDEIIIGHKIVAYIEFIGLMVIFLFLFCSYFKKYHSTSIDLINIMGDWSSFYIFFMFRPTELLNNSSKLYKHYLRQYKYPKVTSKELNKLKVNLQNEFEKEKQTENEMMSKIRNNQINELLNNNSYKEVNQRRDDEVKYDNILKQIRYVDDIENILNGIDSLIHKNEQLVDEIIDDDERNMAKKMEKDQTQNIHKIMMKIASFLASIGLCLFGLILFILKLSQFDFVDNTKINHWSTNDWILCFGFANQLWNMININNIQIHTIYKLLHLNESLKFTNIVSQKISILDGLIKQELCNNHGIKGAILALNINIKFLLKIIVKDPFISFHQLFTYKNKKNDQIEQIKQKENEQGNDDDVNEEKKYPEDEDRQNSVLSVNVDEENASYYQVMLDDIEETKSQHVVTIIHSSFMEMKQNVNAKIELTTKTATIHPYIDAKKIVNKYIDFKDLDITKQCYLKRLMNEENNYNYYSYQFKNEVVLQQNAANIYFFVPNVLLNETILFKIIEWTVTKFLFYAFITLFVLSGILSVLVVIFEEGSSDRCVNFLGIHALNGLGIITISLTCLCCLKMGIIQKKDYCAVIYKLLCTAGLAALVPAQFENAEIIYSSKCKHDLSDINANYPLSAMALYSNASIFFSMITAFALLCIIYIDQLLWVFYFFFVWGSFYWRLIFSIIYYVEFGILTWFRHHKLSYNCSDKIYIKIMMQILYWTIFVQIYLILFVIVIAIPKLVNELVCKKLCKQCQTLCIKCQKVCIKCERLCIKCQKCQTLCKKCQKCKECGIFTEPKCSMYLKCYYYAKPVGCIAILLCTLVLMVVNICFFVLLYITEKSSNKSCSNMIHETALARLEWIAFSDIIITLLACWFWLFHREVGKQLLRDIWYKHIIEKKILRGAGKKRGKQAGKNVAKMK